MSVLKLLMISFLSLIIVYSCAKKNNDNDSSDSVRTCGTFTIGSTSYSNRSFLSVCSNRGNTDDDGTVLYQKNELCIYDNKSLAEWIYFYSDTSCSTLKSNVVLSGTSYDNPFAGSDDNATFHTPDSNTFISGTVNDNNSNVIDNSTYKILTVNSSASKCGVTEFDYKPIYAKSSTVIETMLNTECTVGGVDNISQTGNYNLNGVFTQQ